MLLLMESSLTKSTAQMNDEYAWNQRLACEILYQTLKDAHAIGVSNAYRFRSKDNDKRRHCFMSLRLTAGTLERARIYMEEWVNDPFFLLCASAIGIKEPRVIIYELMDGHGIEDVEPLLYSLRSLRQGKAGCKKLKRSNHAKEG